MINLRHFLPDNVSSPTEPSPKRETKRSCICSDCICDPCLIKKQTPCACKVCTIGELLIKIKIAD